MTAPDSGIDVLDPRFPIDTSREREPWYDSTLRRWRQHNSVFTWEERERRAYQAGVQAAIAANGGERRFIQAPEVDTVTLRAIETPVPYPQLTEPELAHEWDTAPGRVIRWDELEED